MNGRISKRHARSRTRPQLSRTLQETLLGAINSLEDPLPADAACLSLDSANVPTKRGLASSPESSPSFKKPRLGEEINDCNNADCGSMRKNTYASFLEQSFDLDGVHSAKTQERRQLDSFVGGWLQSVGSDEQAYCRSDSFIDSGWEEDSVLARRLAKSAPDMSVNRDEDGFAIPSVPASAMATSAVSGSITPLSGSGTLHSSNKALVETQLYRDVNLLLNDIHLMSLGTPLPEHIATLVNSMASGRNSPGPSADNIVSNWALNQVWNGTDEATVENLFRDEMLPPKADWDKSLECSVRQPMARRTMPYNGSAYKLSNPVPDMLFGYSRQIAFARQQLQLASMGVEPTATNQISGLLYPFLVAEFKGDGGSTWVATNQCLGGVAACVNMGEKLNHRLQSCGGQDVPTLDSAVFGIVMAGTVARLHVAWKQGPTSYHMAHVKSFVIEEPQQYFDFRRYVRNIIDWGRGDRLVAVRAALDHLMEDARKKESEAAKSRLPPFEDPPNGDTEQVLASTSRERGRSRGRSAGRSRGISRGRSRGRSSSAASSRHQDDRDEDVM